MREVHFQYTDILEHKRNFGRGTGDKFRYINFMQYRVIVLEIGDPGLKLRQIEETCEI